MLRPVSEIGARDMPCAFREGQSTWMLCSEIGVRSVAFSICLIVPRILQAWIFRSLNFEPSFIPHEWNHIAYFFYHNVVCSSFAIFTVTSSPVPLFLLALPRFPVSCRVFAKRRVEDDRCRHR